MHQKKLFLRSTPGQIDPWTSVILSQPYNFVGKLKVAQPDLGAFPLFVRSKCILDPLKSTKSSWLKRTAVLISASPNLHMVLRELLRPYHWSVLEPVDDPREAIQHIIDSSADLIIIDESLQLPLARSLRLILSSTAAVLTPVVALTVDSQHHPRAILRHFGEPAILHKPLTPSRFVPFFAALLRSWEDPKRVALRQAKFQLTDGADAAALGLLVKLTRYPNCHFLASIALAQRLRQLGKIKEGERVLTSSLKKNPRHIGVIMALAEYYMYCAMPRLALRLLDSAHIALGKPLYLVPDLVQASLLSGDLETAAVHYEVMMDSSWFKGFGALELTKLHFAIGREAEAKELMGRNEKTYEKLRRLWDGPGSSDKSEASSDETCGNTTNDSRPGNSTASDEQIHTKIDQTSASNKTSKSGRQSDDLAPIQAPTAAVS